MKSKKLNRKLMTLAAILVLIIFGILLATINSDDSEDEIIGGGDAPTDIWIGDENND